MTVRIKPRWISERVTHFHPHPDEGIGAAVAKRCGSAYFQGIADAPWVFLNAGQHPPNGVPVKEYQRNRFVIGTCLSEYDEHGLNEDVRKRYAACSLVVRDLGLEDDPALKPIMEWAVANDRQAHRGAWDLASNMFSINVLLKKPQDAHITMQFADDCFNVAYDYNLMFIEKGEQPVRPTGELNLNEYIVAFLRMEYDHEGRIGRVDPRTARQVAETLGVADLRELKKILELAERKHTEGAATIFDIFSFVEMAVAIGRSSDWISDRLWLVFKARRNEEKIFFNDCDALPATARFLELWRDPANPEPLIEKTSTPDTRQQVHDELSARRCKLVFSVGILESDSPVAHRAFRFMHRMNTMVIRKSNGYTAINIGSKSSGPNGERKQLPRGPFAIRIRRAEEGNWSHSWDELLRDGNTYGPDGKQKPWCNFKEGGWLLNGAFTALDQKELPPTRLSLDRVISEVREALVYIDRQARTPRRNKKKSDRPKSERKQPDPKPGTKHVEPQFTNTPHVKA